jgi:hypothetical protein
MKPPPFIHSGSSPRKHSHDAARIAHLDFSTRHIIFQGRCRKTLACGARWSRGCTVFSGSLHVASTRARFRGGEGEDFTMPHLSNGSGYKYFSQLGSIAYFPLHLCLSLVHIPPPEPPINLLMSPNWSEMKSLQHQSHTCRPMSSPCCSVMEHRVLKPDSRADPPQTSTEIPNGIATHFLPCKK